MTWRLLGRSVFVFCLIANVAVVFSLRMYPFVDLPFHLAAAAIHHDYRSTGSLFPTYFTVRPPFAEPNVLHVLIAGLPVNRLASVDTMNRLILCVYVASLPLVMAALIRRIGGNAWLALLAFPLIFNYNVAWGFVEFVMAIPLVLLLVWEVMGVDRRSGPRSALICGTALILLFYTHVLGMLFAAAFLVSSVLVCVRDERRMWWILPAVVPGVALTCWWWLGHPSSGESTLAFLARYYRTEYFQHFVALRRRILTNDNTQLFAGAAGVAAALALAVPIVVPPLLGLARLKRGAASMIAGTPRRVLLAFTLAAFLCCLLLPDRIPDQTALYERFGVLLLLSMILWSSILYAHVGRVAAIALCLVAVGSTIARVSYFTAFARDAEAFTPSLLPPAAYGRVLLGLMYDERFRGHPAYRHFPDYYIAWSGGIAATELTQFRFGVVRANPQGPALPRFILSPEAFDVSDTVAGADYLLVHGNQPSSTGATNGFTVLRSTQDWRVYQRSQGSAPVEPSVGQ